MELLPEPVNGNRKALLDISGLGDRPSEGKVGCIVCACDLDNIF